MDYLGVKTSTANRVATYSDLAILLGTTASDAGQLSTELTSTASGTNWSGTSLALGYTHVTGSTVPLTSTFAPTVGIYYYISAIISAMTTGSVSLSFGGNTLSLSANGTTVFGPVATTTAVLTVTPTTDFNGNVSVSIKTISPSSPTFSIKNSSGTVANEMRASNNPTNIFIGVSAGANNVYGGYNSAYGYQALRYSSTSSYNTANGACSLYSNSTGYGNVASGVFSLFSNTQGIFNTANGAYSMQYNTLGNYNSANAYGSLNSNVSGTGNVANGYQSLNLNTLGNYNVATGYQSLAANLTSNNNTANGTYSLAFNTAANNTATGYGSSYNSVNGANNVSDGAYSFYYLNATVVSGLFNIGSTYTIKTIGTTDFTLIGAASNTVGVGFTATGVGTGTGTAQTTVASNNNIALGAYSGQNTSTGALLTTAQNSVLLGYSARPLGDNQTNQIVIGANAVGMGSNTTVIGNSSTTVTALYGDVLIGTLVDIPSSILTLSSTSKGVLIPRMTTSLKLAISAPATGLQVYDTTSNTISWYNGTAWQSSSNATLTGDVTTSGSVATVVALNGVTLSTLGTGIIKNTTGTGVPSIAVAADYPTLNQNTTGTSGNLLATAILPSGITAVTPAAGDNSTLLATTAFVIANASTATTASAATYFSTTSGTEITTTSTSDVITDMTLTPGAGTYAVNFNAQYSIVSGNQTTQAVTDLTTAYNYLMGLTATNTTHATAFGGETLTAGIYTVAAAGSLAGNLVLNGQGNSAAIFVFRFGAAFNTGAGTVVSFINGAQSSNVYWIAEGAIGCGATTTMKGTMIAHGAAVSLGASCNLDGRMLSTTGAIGIDTATITTPASSSSCNLGVCSSFCMFTSNGGLTNAGTTTITGNIGTNSGTITGFSSATITGNQYTSGSAGFATATFSIYQNGVYIPYTQRLRTTTTSNDLALQAIATVAAGQAVDVRWSTTLGTIKLQNRILTLIKVAALAATTTTTSTVPNTTAATTTKATTASPTTTTTTTTGGIP